MNKNYSEQQLNRSKPGPFGGDQQTRGESKMAGSSEKFQQFEHWTALYLLSKHSECCSANRLDAGNCSETVQTVSSQD